MGYSGMEVDAVALAAIAAQVKVSAATLTSTNSSSRGRLAPVGEDGWDAATAARSAQDAWGAFLTQLAERLSGLSEGLAEAGRGYTTSDDAAAGRVAGGRIPR